MKILEAIPIKNHERGTDMKTNCTKALSLLLVLAFLMSAVPLFGLTSAAETAEVTLDDGSAWLTELGSNVTFTQNAPGDYIFNGVDGTTANTDFSVISKTGFVVGEDVYGVSLDYRGTAPQFPPRAARSRTRSTRACR